MTRTLLSAACLLAVLPAIVSAQPADEVTPRFQFGPLGLTPKIALKDVGVDTNPLNQAGESARDFTATLLPGVDSWLRLGRARLSGKTSLEWTYFNTSRTQRSFNVNQEGRVEVLLNRAAPFVHGGYLRTRQRPNLEIDLRVQQNATVAGGGLALRLGSRTRLEVEGRRSSLRFGDGRYGDASIGRALDRDAEVYALSTRVTLTPLTTFVLRAEGLRDRFTSTVLRNSDSIAVLPGFELKPSALIAGKVAVGFRRFDATDASVPDFGGLVGHVDAAYTWREATRFGFKADRNIEYSVEEEQPYFVASGGSLEVTQMIGQNWFVIGRGGRTRLAYRKFLDTSALIQAPAGRSDRVDSYGMGIGRRLGEDLKVGVDVNQVRRTSSISARQYQGFRFGVSISYGS